MKTPQPECKKFSERLIEAMLDSGQASLRSSKTGVTTLELRKVAGVTNEMARRYTLGLAWPDNEKMALISSWLGVRRAWLQYNEGPKHPSNNEIYEESGSYNASFQLNNQQISLLQDCMSFALVCSKNYPYQITERIVARAAASFFNHCLRSDCVPEEIPETIIDAVFSTMSGSGKSQIT